MALQHNPYSGPLQTGYIHNSINEEKKADNDEIELESLPLRIFGDGASRFMCEQCNNVPLKVASCNMGHVFCRKCIIVLCEQNELCPADKTQITAPTLKNPILDNMISKEKVTCLYGSSIAVSSNYNEGGLTQKGNDCHWTGSVTQLFDHLKVCKFKPMQCPFDNIGCKPEYNPTKQDSDKMQHYQEYAVIHQDLMLNQIKQLNHKIGSMQKELNELRSIVMSPGGGIHQQLNEIKEKEMEKKEEGIVIETTKNILIGVGCNEKGDLGKGDDDNISSLQELQWSRGLGLSRVVACSYKAFCYITGSMDVYVSGCNDFGQLGLNTEEDEWSAKLHPFFSAQHLGITAVSRSINAFHLFFICDNNRIYCCGANEYGQLGLGDDLQYTTPQINEYFSKNNVIIQNIACGEYHSLFLSSDGVVYSCGLNESFQLGYKTKEEFQKNPKRITDLNCQIVCIAAGRDHSYCLDIDGNIWSFGSNYRGQLGIGKNDGEPNDVEIIHKIKWFENQNKHILSISSGNYHGAAIDKSGNVFVWGRGDEGQIGNGKKVDRFIPTLVDGFEDVRVTTVSCGCHHTVCLTQDNTVHCWGNNRYNQCADTYVDNFDGQHNFIRKPKQYYQINAQSTDKLVYVGAGSYHTLLLLNKM